MTPEEDLVLARAPARVYHGTCGGFAVFVMPETLQKFVGSVTKEIINPILAIIFALALAYFLWGLMTFMVSVGGSGTQEEGRQHMLWGVIGMTIMVGAFAIIQVGLATFGITDLPDGLPK